MVYIEHETAYKVNTRRIKNELYNVNMTYSKYSKYSKY